MRLILTTLAVILFAGPSWGNGHDKVMIIVGKNANEIMANGEILYEPHKSAYQTSFIVRYDARIFFCAVGTGEFWCRKGRL